MLLLDTLIDYYARRGSKIAVGQKSFFGKWDESKHPRQEDGEFAPKGTGGATQADEPFELKRDTVRDAGPDKVPDAKERQGKLLEDADDLPGQKTIFDDDDKQPAAEADEPPADDGEKSLDDQVEEQLLRPSSTHKPEWFDGAAVPGMDQTMHVVKNDDGTYHAWKQFNDHPDLVTPVSHGKNAEDTMNNIWRSGFSMHPESRSLKELIRKGLESDKHKAEDAATAKPGHESPREIAARETQRMIDENYAFARASAVPNAGEDLTGSARHKANAWRGLDQAEEDGTAEKLVTRDQLLANEPHGLSGYVEKNPLTALAMHMAMKAFPPKPGFGQTRYRPDAEQAKKDRAQYVEAYRDLKRKAEELAAHGDDFTHTTELLRNHVSGMIRNLRGQRSEDSVGRATATDPYNSTANALCGLHKALGSWTKTRNSVTGGMQDFMLAVKGKYGDDPRKYTSEHADALRQHALDVIEGQSIDKSFGKDSGKGGGRKFDPAERYVKHAERKGGRMIDANTVKKGTDFILGDLKMRGLQWGNHVSDSERVHHLSKAAEAMADLMDVAGLPDEAASMNGTLGLAIGARGHGNALAHYEPGTRVINLTRTGGVGSLAHEWGHFFDHEIGGGTIIRGMDKAEGSYLSNNISPQRFEKDPATGTWKVDEKGRAVTIDKSKDPLWKAMDDVRQAWNGSGFKQRLRETCREMIRKGELSEARARNYWQSNEEMFARSFECHVKHKLESSGRANTYLAGLEKGGGLWPTEEESAKMAPAFDALFAAFRQEKYPEHEAKAL